MFTTVFAFGDSLSDAGNLYFIDGGRSQNLPISGPFHQRADLGRGPFQ